MMRTGPAWAAGLAASALMHAVAAVILIPAYAPQAPPSQPPPETRLDMETVAAPRQDAAAQEPEGETAAEGRAEGTSVGAGAVPRSDARPVPATAERQAVTSPEATTVEAAATSGTALAEASPDSGRVTATDPVGQTVPLAAPEVGQLAEAPAPRAQPLPAAQADAATIAAAVPQADAVTLATPPADSLAASAPIATQVTETGVSSAEPIPDAQPVPDRLAAVTPEPDRVDATSAEPDIARLSTPPADSLAASEPIATRVAEAAVPSGEPIPDTPPVRDRLAAASPETDRLDAAAAEPETARLATPPADRLSVETPDSTPTEAGTPTTAPAALLAPVTTASAALAPTPQGAPAVAPIPAALPAAPASGEQTVALAATGTAVPQARPDASAAEEATLPATAAKAALAWQFGDRVVTDPQALATIQAFMEPAALDDAEAVKDDLSSVLTGVDCARLSATFIPETGVLEMRGHVPDPALQGPILAALRAQVGEEIPVTANLLHLPKPQCGALSGIASVGLPQSTDQFTNARLVGENAHAREYSYSEGQRLQFDLTAPDYDAYVYVDYFNADGEVIHLVPNDTIALEQHTAKSVFGVGKDRPGKPGLRITIGPPFGQEIAVAFAASHPLYEGLRPIVEPAATYLEELQSLVAEARAEHEDFKGEWVYFFITTSPATQ